MHYATQFIRIKNFSMILVVMFIKLRKKKEAHKDNEVTEHA